MKAMLLLGLCLLLLAGCTNLRKVAVALKPCQASVTAARAYECKTWGWCDDNKPNRGIFYVGDWSTIYFTADTQHPWREWHAPDVVPTEVSCAK